MCNMHIVLTHDAAAQIPTPKGHQGPTSIRTLGTLVLFVRDREGSGFREVERGRTLVFFGSWRCRLGKFAFGPELQGALLHKAAFGDVPRASARIFPLPDISSRLSSKDTSKGMGSWCARATCATLSHVTPPPGRKHRSSTPTSTRPRSCAGGRSPAQGGYACSAAHNQDAEDAEGEEHTHQRHCSQRWPAPALHFMPLSIMITLSQKAHQVDPRSES